MSHHRDDVAELKQAESQAVAAGVRHVLVNGAFVVRDGSIVTDARPGRPVRAEAR